MSLRKPTLDEWFHAYQLRQLQRDGFFNPAMLEVDISHVYRRYQSAGKQLSYPALIIKAYAVAAREVPDINRAYLRTPWGDRVADFDHISVNVPVAKHENGKTYLSAIVIQHADRKSVAEIAREIDRARQSPMDKTLITKWVARTSNHVFARAILRAVHFGAYRWPAWLSSQGGGLSVSSLLDHKRPESSFACVSFGPTATTLLLSSVRVEEDGACVLRLGAGMNHVAVSGLSFKRFCDVLTTHLEASEESMLALWD